MAISAKLGEGSPKRRGGGAHHRKNVFLKGQRKHHLMEHRGGKRT